MINKENSKHYTWGENCDSWVLVDSESLSVKQESMPPGTKEQLHFHQEAQQFFFILKGTASFYLKNEKHILKTQQGLSIQPGLEHYIANESTETIEFLVISEPSTHNDRHLM